MFGDHCFFWGLEIGFTKDSFGGDSSHVQQQLFAVQHVVATSRAFAALRSDGEVICWGDAKYGGKKSAFGLTKFMNGAIY